MQGSAAYLIGLGRRGSHPTGGGGHLGKCFRHATTHVGQCGTGTEQMGTVALSVSPRGASTATVLAPSTYAIEGSHLTLLMCDVFGASCDALQSDREIGFLQET